MILSTALAHIARLTRIDPVGSPISLYFALYKNRLLRGLVGVCLFKWQKGLSDEKTREFRKQAGAAEACKHDDWLHTIKAHHTRPACCIHIQRTPFRTHTHMQAKREAAATQIELTTLKEAI